MLIGILTLLVMMVPARAEMVSLSINEITDLSYGEVLGPRMSFNSCLNLLEQRYEFYYVRGWNHIDSILTDTFAREMMEFNGVTLVLECDATSPRKFSERRFG